MIMAAGLTVSKIDRGQRSEWSRRNEIDCNSLNATVELEWPASAAVCALRMCLVSSLAQSSA